MKRILTASAIGIALAVGAVAAALGATDQRTGGPCTPGAPTIHGHPAVAFCGPATATVHAGGKTYTFEHGFCAKDPKNSLALQLSLGVSVPVLSGPANAGQPYFSMTVGTDHSAAFAAAQAAGKQIVLRSPIRVPGTILSKGVFTGMASRFTGTWNCHGVIYTTSTKTAGG